MNLIKVLSYRFQQCLGAFTILLVEASTEMGLSRHLSDYVFGVRIFQNTKSMWVIFCSKCWKFNLDFENSTKNSEKVFCFLDNCIWIGIVRLSLIRTGYFSSAPNVIKSSGKIWHVKNRDFFKLNFLASDQGIESSCCDGDFKSVWARLSYCLSKHPLKCDFLDIYLATFSESGTSKIQNVWGSSFFKKCLTFNLDIKNAAKNWENVFYFWHNAS